MKPPRLKDDCFALPPGINWTPVDQALAHLVRVLHPVTETETVPLMQACGRFLAAPVYAERSNPPCANSAVDGYGFAHHSVRGDVVTLPLHPGRSAAGVPFSGTVPPGQALRILTGASLPPGVDTVILQEDVSEDREKIVFHAGIRAGANTRKAGEDVKAGAPILQQGHRIRPQDIAILAATGLGEVAVHRPLRIGVLSTGDEVRNVGQSIAESQIYDANRPMLLSLMAQWQYLPVDLGKVGDNREDLRERLDQAARDVDVILTSGGASAGDADHVSALLAQTGTAHLWRVAIKPGRPLALGLWNGVPVFGLPGNPVAAFVCTLVFGAPGFRKLAGGAWREPVAFHVAAAFRKTKKAGRREYLRARLNVKGEVETFGSEGSGRISGLSWAEGLVELPDAAGTIKPGDLVRYLPFSGFME